MQIYSTKHCCDEHFRPPNSRCFDTMEAFEWCCGVGLVQKNVHSAENPRDKYEL